MTRCADYEIIRVAFREMPFSVDMNGKRGSICALRRCMSRGKRLVAFWPGRGAAFASWPILTRPLDAADV